MTEFFGLSMTLIMAVLLVAVGLCVALMAVLGARNRILFQIGLRNIPRRRAQSTLIVVGLMLSTVIIAAAFATGDTVNYSITNETYLRLGHVDEIAQVRDNQDESSLTDEQIAPAGLIPQRIATNLVSDLSGAEGVDGAVAGLRFPVPAANPRLNLIEPEVAVVGLDESSLAGFEDDIVTRSGAQYPLQNLARDQALINESAAAALELQINDRLDLYIDGFPRTVRVAAIVQDRLLTGWTQGQPAGVLVKIETARVLFNTNFFGFVAVSNSGGVRGSLGNTDAVIQAARTSLGQSNIEVAPIKRNRVERAEEVGSNMATIFVVLGLFSIAAGLLLVFLILVMLAAERRSEMGMARAVGMKRRQLIESFMAEGMAYAVTAALAGVIAGVAVSLAMTRVMAYIFDAFDVAIAFHVTPRSLIVSFCLGVVMTFVTVTMSAWRVSNLHIVAAIREFGSEERRVPGALSRGFALVLVAVGAVAIAAGLAWGTGYLFGAGVSLAVIGGAMLVRSIARGGDRIVFTVAGVLVLAIWALIAGDTLEPITGRLDAGVDSFFVSGVLMVAAATVIVIYNVDLLFGVLRFVGVAFARILPAVQTSIAYPLANKFRTGMTIAMLSLVVFALVMISTINLNFQRLFLSDDAEGGWDIVVEENPINPLPATDHRLGPLGQTLERQFYDVRNIEAIGQALTGNPRTTQVAQVPADPREDPDTHSFAVVGASDSFLQQNEIGLQARAKGFDSDRAVWDAVQADINNAVIDGSVVPGINYANVTESRFTLDGYESGTRTFTPFPMYFLDTAQQKVVPVRIIGIMNRAPSETFAGLYVNETAYKQGAIPALFSRYYIRLAPDLDADEQARDIETRLAAAGISAESIRHQVEADQRLSSAFFYLIQGFMALGLVVGLAALGVIAFRTVVERRQQIGLMRAIGFSRTNVALTFVLESAFIAAVGIFNGIWLALLLANRLLASDAFSTAGFTSFHVPWLQISGMAVLVFLASVLTTLIPSRQASSIPAAEALRYE